jgi:hypothetical protein
MAPSELEQLLVSAAPFETGDPDPANGLYCLHHLWICQRIRQSVELQGVFAGIDTGRSVHGKNKRQGTGQSRGRGEHKRREAKQAAGVAQGLAQRACSTAVVTYLQVRTAAHHEAILVDPGLKGMLIRRACIRAAFNFPAIGRVRQIARKTAFLPLLPDDCGGTFTATS